MTAQDPPGHPPLSASFRHFLWCRMLGTTANQMVLVALAWQMYDITGSAWDLGLVGLAQFIPTLALTIPFGQLADRMDRRKVLALSLALQGAVALLLAWASVSGWADRALILGVSMAMGMARALLTPAQQALVPSLVPRAQLAQAMAQSTAVMKVAVIGGPALGGFVYATGAVWVYALCGVFIVLSLVELARIRKSDPPRKEPVTLGTVFAGFRFIWHQKAVLGAISLDLFAVVLGGVTALLPIYARDILHTGPWGLGLLRAAPALGALVMAWVLSRHPLERHVGRWMFGSVGIYGLSILGFAYSTDFVLSMLLLAASGAGDMVSIVIRQTLVQLETPDEMRGRVSAVNATFISTSNHLGEFRSGAVAAWLGTVGSVVVGAVGTLAVVALWMRLFPSLAKRDKLS